MKGWENFIATSKIWTVVKPIGDEYTNLTLVYEQVKNVEKLFGKVLINCRTNIHKKKHIHRKL